MRAQQLCKKINHCDFVLNGPGYGMMTTLNCSCLLSTCDPAKDIASCEQHLASTCRSTTDCEAEEPEMPPRRSSPHWDAVDTSNTASNSAWLVFMVRHYSFGTENRNLRSGPTVMRYGHKKKRPSNHPFFGFLY
jgi:hypothetical protein